MSSPISNIWQGVVINLKQLCDPIILAATDESARRALLAAAGLDPNRATDNTIIIPADQIGKIDNFTNQPAEAASLEQFFEVLEAVLQVINALEALVRAVIASTEGDDEVLVDELMHFYINLLTLSYFKQHAKPVYALFEILGAIEDHAINFGNLSGFFKGGFGYLKELYAPEPEPGDPRTRAEIEEAQAKGLSDGILFPVGLAIAIFLKPDILYGYDGVDRPTSPNADRVLERTLSMLFKGKTKDGDGNDVTGKLLLQTALIPPVHHGKSDKFGIIFRIKGSGGIKADLGKGIELEVEIGGPDIMFSFPSLNDLPTTSTADVKFKLIHTSKKDNKAIIGDPEGTHLLFGKTGAEGKFSPEKIDVKGYTKKGELVIKAKDGFINTFLPDDGLKIKFDLTIGYSTKKGFYIEGGVGLLITLAIHKQFGPLYIETITIGGKLKTPSDSDNSFLELEASAGFSLKLAAFTAVVERIGLSSDLGVAEEGSRGNLGPLDLGFGFKPPNGIGLSIDAEAVKGGGYLFFDPDNGFYAGAVELSVLDKIVISGIAIITTKRPDGSDGFSMLVIINVRFEPGIALGAGVFLTGLGGMIGINQSVNVEALRAGVKNNTVDHILFPENIIANISRIISDLRVIFPPREGQFLIGFFAKLTWGAPKLFDIEFGLIIEFSSPVRIAILGVFRAVVPKKEAPILSLQVNFLGIIDFDAKMISFDASLYNSSLLAFKLEGDMALRVKWGDNGGFLVSVGGFHPAYTPPANLNLPEMKRLSISLLSGNPRLTFSVYLAFGSNTVQFGALADFQFKVSKFGVYGYLGFDVLFEFRPFRFMAGIRAGVEVRIGSSTLFSISLSLELEGPTPWMARGTAKFRILFFSVKVRFSKTWGEDPAAIEPETMVAPLIEQAMQDESNWEVALPEKRKQLVSIRELTDNRDLLRLSTSGSLIVSQHLLPFQVEITRLGNQPIGDIKFMEVKSVSVEGSPVDMEAVKGDFAPATFKEMSHEDKLAAPSFIKEQNGIKLKDADKLRLQYVTHRRVDYEQRISDFDRRVSVDPDIRKGGLANDDMDLFCKMAGGGAIGRSSLSKRNKLLKQQLVGAKVDLTEESFHLVSTLDLKPLSNQEFSGGNLAQADDALRKVLRARPDLKGKVAIVPEYEMNTELV